MHAPIDRRAPRLLLNVDTLRRSAQIPVPKKGNDVRGRPSGNAPSQYSGQPAPLVDPPPPELRLYGCSGAAETNSNISNTDEETTTMKPLLGTLALGALLAISSTVIAADAPDPVIGTWKLNTAKSTGTTLPKSETRMYTASGGSIVLTWKRVGADGKETSVQTTYKYDGKDYPVTGSPDFDTVSGKRVDANTVDSTQKRMGKVVGTTTRTVSKDGKTLTLVSKLTNAKGEATNTTLVYDRQ
jgi:hypothetical protein